MSTQSVRIEVADPTPLGLFGLAMVTLVASSQKLGFTDGLSLLVPWAFFLGGVAQIIASLFDFKHNNLFGSTAFAAYGLFWIAVGFSWLISMGVLGETLKAAADTRQLGVAFIGYLILSVVLTISTLKASKLMFILMITICLLFVFLAADALRVAGPWKMLAAWDELLISLLTFYALAAKYLQLSFGKPLLPVGTPLLK